MTQVIIQPSYGNRAAREHWAQTLDREVDFASGPVANALTAQERQALLRLHPEGRARFWGATSVHDDRMGTLREGDVVLFTGQKMVRGVGEVGVSFRSEAVADRLWPPDPDRGSYRNVYSLRAFEPTDIPYEEIWALPGFNPGDNFMGLRFLNPDLSAQVLEGLGISTLTEAEREAAWARRIEDDLRQGRSIASGAELVAGERSHTESTTYHSPGGTRLVRRTESLLVQEYARSIGLDSPERSRSQAGLSDLVDRRQGRYELVEAKSDMSRSKIREAVGQLLDYGATDQQITSLAVLVPARPDASVTSYVNRYGIDVIYRTAPGMFARHDAPAGSREHLLQLVRGLSTEASSTSQAGSGRPAAFPAPAAAAVTRPAGTPAAQNTRGAHSPATRGVGRGL